MSPFIMTVMTGVVQKKSWGFTFFFFFLLLACFLSWIELDLALVYIQPVREEMKKKNSKYIISTSQQCKVLCALAQNPKKH